MALLMATRTESDVMMHVCDFLIVEINEDLVELLERIRDQMPWTMFPEMTYAELLANVHPTDISPIDMGLFTENDLLEYEKIVNNEVVWRGDAHVFFEGDISDFESPQDYDWEEGRVRASRYGGLAFFAAIESDYNRVEAYTWFPDEKAILAEIKQKLEAK